MTYKLPEPISRDDTEHNKDYYTAETTQRIADAAYAAGLAAGAPKWLPIESAPKDCEGFDAWNGAERVADVFWSRPDYSTKEHRAFCVYEYEQGYGYVCTEVKNLTHWMPLPAAPEPKP